MIPCAGAGKASPCPHEQHLPFSPTVILSLSSKIIKIHLYLICLLELIEFLRLANVSGCTLPPNGDPAAGAAGAAPGSHRSPGINPTPEQGTGCPQALLARAAGCQDASTLLAPHQCSATPGVHPPNLPVEGGSPKSHGIPTVVALQGTRGAPLSLSHTHAGDAGALPGIVVALRVRRAFVPSPSSSSSQIAKASNLPAGKAEGKEPLFCR